MSKLNMKDVRDCFHVPGETGIIDIVNPFTGLGHYSGKNLKAMQEENNAIVIGNFDEVVKAKAELWKSPPVEITEERFFEMLNILPPVGWKHLRDGEVFKMSELTSGNITGIYCRIGERYFHMSDSIYTKPEAIYDACLKVAKGKS